METVESSRVHHSRCGVWGLILLTTKSQLQIYQVQGLSMSSSLDKDMMGLSIEEEDVPFNLLDLPEYCSSEKNELSIIGRILNPYSQKIANVILDMPRKWQIYDRVRGVALSKERFQFIFKYEHDLEDILNKWVHTYNEWALAIDRWVESPPTDYLHFTPIWVQIRNMPVNYYTVASITALGELIGQVIEVAYDPTKSQSKDYVRVRVKIDISRPLRRAKVSNLPNGETTSILFDYERVQKRCFTCQRLTHVQEKCPIWLKKNNESEGESSLKKTVLTKSAEPIIKPSDLLFGVLKESQVGLNPLTGRHMIDPEVLENTRNYLLMVDGAETKIREERVKKSIADIGDDLFAQKSLLSLEPLPVISSNIDKGKGRVFDYMDIRSKRDQWKLRS